MNPYHLAQIRQFIELMRMCSEVWEMAERKNHGCNPVLANNRNAGGIRK